MQENNQLLELSLQGKWIKLAAVWIKANAPVSVDDYFLTVTPLMPTHIKRYGKRASAAQLTLAKQALQSINVVIADGIIQGVVKRQRNCFREWFGYVKQNAVNGVLDLRFGSTSLSRGDTDSLRRYLRREGCRFESRGVYNVEEFITKMEKNMDEKKKMARTSDPSTSHEAAEKMVDSGRASGQRKVVLGLVQRNPDSTSAEIAKIGFLDRYTPSRRLPELVRMGLVEVSGKRQCSTNGNTMQTYRINQDGEAQCQHQSQPNQSLPSPQKAPSIPKQFQKSPAELE